MTTQRAEVHVGDIMEWCRTYDGEKYMACICDPPYHLHPSMTKARPDLANYDGGKGTPYARQQARTGFMSSEWDGGDIAFRPETWAALKQHLYPGAFLFAYAGTRGYHRQACAIEDAGFILHPCMCWLSIQGMPKATRICTQIDRAAGAEREIVGTRQGTGSKVMCGVANGKGFESVISQTLPATALARDWQGHRYGLQALAPAVEMVCVAQVPYEGKPVDSMVKYGSGALNIDAARIPRGTEYQKAGFGPRYGASSMPQFGSLQTRPYVQEAIASGEPVKNSQAHSLGGWPKNFACDSESAALLDRQSGITKSGAIKAGQSNGTNFQQSHQRTAQYDVPANEGGISRCVFKSDWNFETVEAIAHAEPVRYCPKASAGEKELGLEGFPVQSTRKWASETGMALTGSGNPRIEEGRNTHPCVKPCSLNAHFARLLCPPDRYAPRRLLQPFSGSGSEILGALMAGWEFVQGIEQSEEYAQIARSRIAYYQANVGLFAPDPADTDTPPEPGQMDMEI